MARSLSAERPSLARALYDAYRALPKRERAAFDQLMHEAAEAAPLTGAALTRQALAEVRSGNARPYAGLDDLLQDR